MGLKKLLFRSEQADLQGHKSLAQRGGTQIHEATEFQSIQLTKQPRVREERDSKGDGALGERDCVDT